MEKFCDFKHKEVINISDGCRLGYVDDIEFDRRTGKIFFIIIYNTPKFLCIFGKECEYKIPWNEIKKIGDDIILVDVNISDIKCENECYNEKC